MRSFSGLMRIDGTRLCICHGSSINDFDGTVDIEFNAAVLDNIIWNFRRVDILAELNAIFEY